METVGPTSKCVDFEIMTNWEYNSTTIPPIYGGACYEVCVCACVRACVCVCVHVCVCVRNLGCVQYTLACIVAGPSTVTQSAAATYVPLQMLKWYLLWYVCTYV